MALKQDISSGYAALRDAAAIVDRSAAGRILLRGADRRSYLQGLLTNDIAALTPGTGCYAAMLTAQGRMIADMRVLELGDAVLLDVPRELAASVSAHLDRFVFTEDVQVEDATAARDEIGLYGPRSLELLRRAGVEGVDGSAAAVPPTLFGSARVRVSGHDAVLVRSDEAGVEGVDLIVDAAAAGDVRGALIAAGAVEASAEDAEAVRVESGRPRFGMDLDTDTIPLEAGLEERAISRSKGCYVGQEVIVRVQDRGHGRVARRLVGLMFGADAAVPARGSAMTADGREIGRVTSAVWSPSLRRPIALGYVHRDFTAPGTRVEVAGLEGVVAALPFVPAQARD